MMMALLNYNLMLNKIFPQGIIILGHIYMISYMYFLLSYFETYSFLKIIICIFYMHILFHVKRKKEYYVDNFYSYIHWIGFPTHF